MFQQKKRIKQAPKLSSGQIKALKTSPTKRVPKTYSTPIDLLKGLSKKEKNMVLCNTPTRINVRLNLVMSPWSTIFDTTSDQNCVC